MSGASVVADGVVRKNRRRRGRQRRSVTADSSLGAGNGIARSS